MPEFAAKGMSMDRALERFDSKFRFVLLASARAEQVIRGAHPKLEGIGKKPTRIAMEEIKRGLVEWGYGLPPTADAGEPTGDAAPGAAEERADGGEKH
jgi:DNA-directed RNA polymerase omega subunit